MREHLRCGVVLLLVCLSASCALHFPSEVSGHRRVEVASRHQEVVEPPTVPVWLVADKLHTGLVFELAWLERHGYRKPKEIGEHQYVCFSWGDETAYVQKRWLNPAQVVHALFLPSDSVMEIIPFDWNVPEVCIHQRIYQTHVPDSSGGRFAASLNGCSTLLPDGSPETAGRAPWGDGILIRSPHSYYFPRICNVWTVDVLNAGGFDFSGLSGLSANGVVEQALLEKNGFQQIWDPAWRTEEQMQKEP